MDFVRLFKSWFSLHSHLSFDNRHSDHLPSYHQFIYRICPGPHQNKGRGWRRDTGLSPAVKYFY